MNERIKELALQVDLMRYPSDGINIKIEKFAELIVRECTAVSRKSSKRIDDMGSLIAQDIEKHFGVE